MAVSRDSRGPQYPFKEVGSRKDDENLARFALDSDAGAVKPALSVPRKFLQAQKANSVSHTDLRPAEAPHWARRVIAAKGDAGAMAAAAVERALKNPNEATLREVESVLNEMGRDAERAAAVTKLLTPTTLGKVMKRE